jgi:methylmalonyl-CoA/ethylmalonyl-CoA epimerase
MFTQIRETSIAVANLDAAVAAFEEKLGLQPSSTNVDPRPPVESRAAMYRIGDSSLALMESTSAGGPIDRFVQRRGEGLFSVSVAVDDLDEATARMQAAGVDLVLPEPMLFEDFPAFDRSYSKVRMNFTRPSSLHGVLIEVQELTP